MVVAGFIALTALFDPRLAHAQSTFGSVQATGLPTVFVTDRSGQEIKGTLERLTESEIAILVNGTTKTFMPDEVSTIERKGDSLKNGALIGLGFGAITGVLTMGLADCPAGNSSCPGERLAMILLNAGIYTAVGTAIDAAIPGRTRIWPQKHGKAGAPVVSVSPVERRAFIGWRIGR
jgi:hypothetical protein